MPYRNPSSIMEGKTQSPECAAGGREAIKELPQKTNGLSPRERAKAVLMSGWCPIKCPTPTLQPL